MLNTSSRPVELTRTITIALSQQDWEGLMKLQPQPVKWLTELIYQEISAEKPEGED